MAQKKITVVQVEAGKQGFSDLGARLDNMDTAIESVNTNLQNEINANEAEIARVNEVVMAMASAPISTPVFNDIETYSVTAAVAEVFDLTVTTGATADGNVQVTLNGGAATDIAVVAGDSAETVAGKIQTVIDALADYTASVSGAVVTVTAVNKRSEVDATFNGGVTGVTATVSVTTQGVDGVDVDNAVTITIPNGKSYKVGKGNLLVLRNGIPQVLANGDYIEVDSVSIQYSAGVLKDGDVITFMIGNPSKLNYNVAVTYYGAGADEGRIETVTYTGDIERTITYTYTAEGKINTETIVEGGKTTTKTYTYDGTTGKITGVSAIVA